MITRFRGKRITAMLGILPQTIGYFDDEVDNYSFPPKQTMRLKKIMGYKQHRLAKESSAVSDFAVYGLNYMLENAWINREEIGAVVTVTLCPDHFVLISVILYMPNVTWIRMLYAMILHRAAAVF